MKTKAIISELNSLRDDKVFNQYLKGGADKNKLLGVKLGDIRKLSKKLKIDHPTALKLWESEIIEARFLACLNIKGTSLTIEHLDYLVKSINYDRVADWFNAYVLKNHPNLDELRNLWMNSDNKWALRAGWHLTANKIVKDTSDLNLSEILDYIEKEMPNIHPEVKWTMNFALAHIGIYHPDLRKRAIEIGNKLGIYKDYPVSKGCVSPFAPIWIEEMSKRL